MTRVSLLEKAKQAWANDYAGLSEAEIGVPVRRFATIVRAIATQGSLAADRVAEAIGSDVSETERLVAELSAIGVQFDETGNIIGAALTTRETPHRMRIRGNGLYAWCALDTLFIPGLIGETAEVESTCPQSGAAIRLTVSPTGIESCEPSEAWISVFLPGGSRKIGPASPT